MPTKKLKILYHHRVAAQDGQSVHIKELVAAFERQGHIVIFVGPSLRPKELGQENKTLKIIRGIFPQWLQELLELAYGMRAYFKLKAAYHKHKPDIIYERYNLFLPAASRLRKITQTPYFVEVNAPLSDERAEHGGLSLKSLARYYERKTFSKADYIFPVSQVLADIICEKGAHPKQIKVLHNGILPNDYIEADGLSTRRKYGLAGKIVLGFVGFVRDWHRLDRIINMLGKSETNDDLHLLVVGDGPSIADCRKLAIEIGVIDRVHFAGFKDRSSIPNLLASMNIALQPAVTEYASPLKIFEYMISGLAIVAPNQPNIREILTHEHNGLLFDPSNPQSIEDCISRLSNDPDLLRKIGQAAKETIYEKRFTWDDNASQIIKLADSLISNKAT